MLLRLKFKESDYDSCQCENLYHDQCKPNVKEYEIILKDNLDIILDNVDDLGNVTPEGLKLYDEIYKDNSMYTEVQVISGILYKSIKEQFRIDKLNNTNNIRSRRKMLLFTDYYELASYVKETSLLYNDSLYNKDECELLIYREYVEENDFREKNLQYEYYSFSEYKNFAKSEFSSLADFRHEYDEDY